MAKTETKIEKLLRWVKEQDARGETCYVELGRYKPFMPNTVRALVKRGTVTIVKGSTYQGFVVSKLVAFP